MSRDFTPTLLPDKSKTNLSEFDIFDRVINLKLYAQNAYGISKDEYVIRSDYEIYYPDLMDNVVEGKSNLLGVSRVAQIRKCQHKPSIKIQYKRVSLNASIEVDIFISNFYMLDKDGKLISGFNNETYKLSRVDFSMGYFGQFKALFTDSFKSIQPKDLTTIGFNNEVGHGISTMTMSNVQYSQMDKLPPDAVLHIHGFVGNTLSSKFELSESMADNFPTEYNKILTSSLTIPSELTSGKDTYLDQFYYETITRQWLKKGSPSEVESAKLAVTSSGATVTAGTGMLSDSDAEKYGIKVYLSKGAKEYSKEKFDSIYKKDANGNLVKPKVKIGSASTAEGKMNVIANDLGLEGFTHTVFDGTGDFIVYLLEELEDIENLLKGTTLENEYKETALAKYWNNNIPAVYNITTDSLCTIVCPFFCFINPFEKMYFKSRYALGGLVSYYAKFTNANRDEFYALWQNVSFATVEDVNECMIVCTGTKGA